MLLKFWNSEDFQRVPELVPGIFNFFGGIGTGIGKNWYRKKVSEPVSAKFGTGKSLGTGIGKIWYRKKVSELVSDKFGTGADFFAKILEFKSFLMDIGTGTGNFLFFLVVSEKFGTGKKYRYRYQKYLVPEKSIGIGIVQHFGYRQEAIRQYPSLFQIL